MAGLWLSGCEPKKSDSSSAPDSTPPGAQDAADTGTADTGTADTGTADTGTADTGTADTGAADTGGDGTITYKFTAAFGTVTRFEAGPAYDATLAQAADDPASTDRVYSLDAKDGKTPLTRWHVTHVIQNPANCLGAPVPDLTWNTESNIWQWRVPKAKIDAAESGANCAVTIDVDMGEHVTAAWVAELVSTGVDYSEVPVDGDAKMTKSCISCHGDVGGGSAYNGYFRTKVDHDNDGTTTCGTACEFSLAQFIANIEDTGTFPGGTAELNPAVSYLRANAAAASFQGPQGAQLTGACTGGAVVNEPVAPIKRVDPGNPMNSLLVMITDIADQSDTANFFAKDYINGGEFRLCNGNNIERIWMPKGQKNASTTKYVWPKWAHDKFARWVLQGAPTTD